MTQAGTFIRHTPTTLETPLSQPDAAVLAQAGAAGIDLRAIARAAVARPPNTTPDRVIRAGLAAAGVPGTWSTSPTFRRLWAVTVALWVRYGGAGTSAAGTAAVPAAAGARYGIDVDYLWRAYDRGETQSAIARRLGMSSFTVCTRSRELGFRLARKPAPEVLAGPCRFCGRPFAVEELSVFHVCTRCAEED